MTEPSSDTGDRPGTNPIEDANEQLAGPWPRVVEFGERGVAIRVDGLEAARMGHTVIQTDVPGFGWAVAAGTNGLEVQPLDYRAELTELEGPAYVVHRRSVRTVRSFLDEVRRRPLDPLASTLSARDRDLTVTAVYDDHEGGPLPRRAGRRQDWLTLDLQMDPDFKAWLDIDGHWFNQQDFSDALEERLHTVVDPDQADLLGVVENLRVTSHGHAESRLNRANGSVFVELHDDHKVSAGTLEVPETITFRVPVHEGAAVKYDFGAWFRVQLNRGEVRVCAKVKPHRQTLLAAWQHVLDDISDGLPRTGENGSDAVYSILNV